MNDSKYEFTYNSPDKSEFPSQITVKSNAESLSSVVDAFESFLKASGFCFDGKHLELIDDDPILGRTAQESILDDVNIITGAGVR